jgi:hypothetical protein
MLVGRRIAGAKGEQAVKGESETSKPRSRAATKAVKPAKDSKTW